MFQSTQEEREAFPEITALRAGVKFRQAGQPRLIREVQTVKQTRRDEIWKVRVVEGDLVGVTLRHVRAGWEHRCANHRCPVPLISPGQWYVSSSSVGVKTNYYHEPCLPEMYWPLARRLPLRQPPS